MTSERPSDHEIRERIARDLDTTFVVEAAAGTGKTSTLVSRMLGVLESGRGRLDQMVAVTFTEAASGELKIRLRAEIERRRIESDDAAVQTRLEQALARLEAARIGTIHGFCADLLAERPVEARVDPRFQVATEDVSRVLVSQAFDRWFEEVLADPPEGVRRALRRGRRGEGPRKALRQAASTLIKRRDFPAPWAASPIDRKVRIDTLIADLRALAMRAEAYPENDGFRLCLDEIAAFVSEIDRRERLTEARDYDGLEARLVEIAHPWSAFQHWEKTGRRLDGRSEDVQARARRKTDDIARRDAVRAALGAFRLDVNADLAPRLQHDLWPVVAAYEQLKARAGLLDFLDLLLRARDLIVRCAPVRNAFQRRFTHVFVDEFQDTDPVQAELLLLLAADDPDETDWTKVRPVPGKLFIVGDPKQSIYRFRRADVAFYRNVVARLTAYGAEVLHLSVSFRSASAIQSAVNAAFAPHMDGATPSQPAYVPLSPYRTAVPGQPALIALPAHAPFSAYGRVTKRAVAASTPETVAGFVEWLVNDSGWRVSDREGEVVAVGPQHICLLFKRFQSMGSDITAPYVHALEAREIPHVLVGGSALHRREEVIALRNALTAIEHPDDELAVYATMRGPFLAVDDGALLAWKHHAGHLHPLHATVDECPSALLHVAEALEVLGSLHLERNLLPVSSTIGRLLHHTRAHAGLALWPGGEQALANIHRVLDAARRAERGAVTSFRAFVEHLEDEAQGGDAGEAPIVEEGADGVRLMTVHGAKGLEFPVVILVDPGAPLVTQTADRWVDSARGLCAMTLLDCAPRELCEHGDDEIARQSEEGHRLLYVAATRARDLLVVTTAAPERVQGWLSPLHPVLYPCPERASFPVSLTPEGCGDFHRDEPDGPEQRVIGVAPGLHLPEAGETPVVWWDTDRLRLGVGRGVGVRQQYLLEAEDGDAAWRSGTEAHARWAHVRQEVLAAASHPSARVVTATEAAEAGISPPAGFEMRVHARHVSEERPGGRRFGVLVHAVLAVIDLDADLATVVECTALWGRILGAPADEVEAGARAVRDALATPLLRRASAASARGELRREMPVAWVADDGALVEGVLDAAFLEEGGWIVIDFKTDVDPSLRLDAYRTQLACYCEALHRVTGKPVREAVLLLV